MVLRIPVCSWCDCGPCICPGAVDDIAIDVCVGCGRYFEWTDEQARLARERHPNSRQLEQQCVPCLRGIPPRHEY